MLDTEEPCSGPSAHSSLSQQAHPLMQSSFSQSYRTGTRLVEVSSSRDWRGRHQRRSRRSEEAIASIGLASFGTDPLSKAVRRRSYSRMTLTQYFLPLLLCSSCSRSPRPRRGPDLIPKHTPPSHDSLPQICSQHEHRADQQKPAALPCAWLSSAAALNCDRRTF